MDADRKRQILAAEARAELIATLVGRGVYVLGGTEIERLSASDAVPAGELSTAPAPGVQDRRPPAG